MNFMANETVFRTIGDRLHRIRGEYCFLKIYCQKSFVFLRNPADPTEILFLLEN